MIQGITHHFFYKVHDLFVSNSCVGAKSDTGEVFTVRSCCVNTPHDPNTYLIFTNTLTKNKHEVYRENNEDIMLSMNEQGGKGFYLYDNKGNCKILLPMMECGNDTTLVLNNFLQGTTEMCEKSLISADKQKTYKTRDGQEARIYSIDGGGWQKVHGAIKSNCGENKWRLQCWGITGNASDDGKEHSWDLVEVKPKVRVRGWLNINSNGEGFLYNDRCSADSHSLGTRIACVHLDQENENSLS